MSIRVMGFTIAAALTGQCAMLAQTANAQPPVPNDPLELVTGAAQPVQNAAQRAVAASLLDQAHQLSNVRAYAFDLKTSFVSTGASEGSWSLEDAAPSRHLYRWTAQGPGYSAANLYNNQLLYGDPAAGNMPLRLAQVRAAMFFAYQAFGPLATMRTAAGSLNGAAVNCVLLSHTSQKDVSGGRRWDESEYCVDPKSGLLLTYSPVPGVYVSYDYTNALHFHDKIIAGKFTITEAGQTVAEARTESVTDTSKMDPALFQPAGMQKIGAGSLMTRPWKVRSMATPGASPNLAPQFVVLDGLLTPDGQMREIQVASTSDASLNQAALEKALAWKSGRSAEDPKPGATPQSHEVFFTVQFGPSAP